MKTNEQTVCVFATESGSRYEISNGMIRRLNPGAGKRGDGDWQELIEFPELWIGCPASIVMETLSGYGADDFGNYGPVTKRTTTPVVGITVPEGIEEEVPF